MKSVLDFKAHKGRGPKISMVSAYTHWEARGADGDGPGLKKFAATRNFATVPSCR